MTFENAKVVKIGKGHF